MHGFKEEDLLTEKARQHYVEWKESSNTQSDYHAKGSPYTPASGGTINGRVLEGNGDIAGVTSTVGHHFKIVGRVGDSAIIGAGLYVDNEIGAAGGTGQGEESIKVCASFLAVEKMREGMSPQDACNYVCQRVVDRHQGNPLFGLKIVALSKDGQYGCCSIRGRFEKDLGIWTGAIFYVHDQRGPRLETGNSLLPPMTPEERAALPRR